jgi:hypothetical protein
MATIDYSVGFEVYEIEDILAAQKAELKKVLQAHSDSGTSVTKRRLDEIHTIIAACQKALQKMSPTTYGTPQPRTAQAINTIRIPR